MNTQMPPSSNQDQENTPSSGGEKKFDAVVVGMGHQGLIAASYLARSGVKVAIVDCLPGRDGGHPYAPFSGMIKTGPCAHTPLPVSQSVAEDLHLEDHGWSFKPEQACSFSPQSSASNDYLFATSGRAATQREIAKYSKEDAERFIEFFERLSALAQIFDSVSDQIPLYDQKGWKDLWGVFETGKLLSRAGDEAQSLFAALMTQSLAEFLNGYFESDAVKGFLAFQASVGGMTNADRKGSAATLLQYILGLGRHRPLKGDWQPIRGSLHNYMLALTSCAMSYGVEFFPDNHVKELRFQQGQVLSAILDDGLRLSAPHFLADVNPIHLFSDIVDPVALPADFRLKIQSLKGKSGFARLKILTNQLPKFGGLSGFGDESFLGGDVLIAPSLEYMRTSLSEAREFSGAQLPAVSLTVPSIHSGLLGGDDQTQGFHALSAVAQYFDPEMDNIPDNHEAIATSVARAIEQMAPGFAETVVDYAVYIGDDLDKTMGPLSRDTFQGNAPLNQVFAGHFGHHALGVSVPMQNLTLCGYGPEASAGSHTNNGGIQAAERILSLMNRSMMRGTG